MKVYKIKSLIDGYKVSPKFNRKTVVCCKASKGYTHIQFGKEIMRLSEPILTLPFQDHFNRGTYFLDYYEWTPLAPVNLWSIK